jgi:lipopolysaccharide export system protein LptC
MRQSLGSRLKDYLVDLAIRFIPITVLAALALLTYSYLKTNTKVDPPVEARTKVHIPDYIFDNARLTVLDEQGQTKYRLLGKKFSHFEDDASIDISEPQIRFFTKGTPPTTISSVKGHLDGDVSILELFDRAEIFRPDQIGKSGGIINPRLKATSNYFKIFINDDIIETDLPVRIERGQSLITASKGAHFENVDQKMTLLGDVKGYIVPTESK